jgi:hypothetical protein
MPKKIHTYRDFYLLTRTPTDFLSSKSGPRWEAVKKAYQNFDFTKNNLNALKLYNNLEIYVSKHNSANGDLSKIERNKGNIIGDLFESLLEEYPSIKGGEKQILAEIEAPHNRLGALHVLSQLKMNKHFGLDAHALRIAGLGLGLGGVTIETNFSDLQNVDNEVHDGNRDGVQIGIGLYKGIGDAFESRMLKKQQKSKVFTEFMTYEKYRTLGGINANLPTILPTDSFKVQQVPDLNYTIDSVDGKFIGDEDIVRVIRTKHKRNKPSGLTGKDFKERIHKFMVWIKNELEKWIRAKIEKMSSSAKNFVDETIKYAALILKTILPLIYKQSVPFIGNLVNVTESAFNLVEQIGEYAVLKHNVFNANFSSGLPSEIADSMVDHHRKKYQATFREGAVYSAQAAVENSFPGIGPVVNCLVSVMKYMYLMVMKFLEVKQLDEFFDDARKKYNEFKNTPEGTKSFVHNSDDFTKWFREGCLTSPLIPAVILKSGYCGNWMSWCNLFVASQHISVSAGVAAMENLKAAATEILQENKAKIVAYNGASASDAGQLLSSNAANVEGQRFIDLIYSAKNDLSEEIILKEQTRV